MGHNEQGQQRTEPLRVVVYVRISDDPEGTEQRLVEEAVLATFEQITLHPARANPVTRASLRGLG